MSVLLDDHWSVSLALVAGHDSKRRRPVVSKTAGATSP
jgi:hypothetical protein